MIIWIMDYCNGEVLRINPLSDTLQEIREVYLNDVEAWLSDHEKELGIRMDDCYYMTDDDNKEYRSIHI